MANRLPRQTTHVVDVSAKSITRWSPDWRVVEQSEASLRVAQELMCCEKLDIVPIGRDEPTRYFRTNASNDYSAVVEREISHTDVVGPDMGIRDIIRRLADEKRNFFFVGEGRRVRGLLSIVNLNDRPVKVYLFNLLGVRPLTASVGGVDNPTLV
jgi:hypothetical protein